MTTAARGPSRGSADALVNVRSSGDSGLVTNGTTSSGGSARRRGLLIATVIGAVVVVFLLILLLTGTFSGGEESSSQGVSREVSTSELRDFAGSSGRTVYWAGVLRGRRLELSEARSNVWVRYLTGDAVVGDGRPAFTTIGTYPFDSSLREVRRRSKVKGMDSRPAPDGGLATWSLKRPNSVYLAFPDSNVLVEVYDPDAERARQFAISGDVGPIR